MYRDWPPGVGTEAREKREATGHTAPTMAELLVNGLGIASGRALWPVSPIFAMTSLTFGAALAATVAIASAGPVGPTFLLFTFPGTVAHELAHFLVAFILRANPRLPRLWPRREGIRWILGSVTFEVGWFSAGLVALAPAALLPLGAWACHAALPVEEGLEAAALGYTAGVLLWGAVPSPQDFRIALRYPAGPGLVFAFGYLTYLAATQQPVG